MTFQDHFPRLGWDDVHDELFTAQHFKTMADEYRKAGFEEEAAEFTGMSTRHWQRAGWIAERLQSTADAAQAAAETQPELSKDAGAVADDPFKDCPQLRPNLPAQEPELTSAAKALLETIAVDEVVH